MNFTYWLIVYKRSEGQLQRCDPFDSSRAALAERFRLEHEHRDDPDLEIVAIGSESLETLKVNHARYFLTLPELVTQAENLAAADLDPRWGK